MQAESQLLIYCYFTFHLRTATIISNPAQPVNFGPATRALHTTTSMSSLTLLSVGSNGKGQLAIGNVDDAHAFTACSFLDCLPGTLPPGTQRIVDIACGGNHTLLLLERVDEASPEPYLELWGCGDGSKVQLGVGIFSTEVFRPLDLELRRVYFPMYKAKMIAAGWETSYVIIGCYPGSDLLLSFGSNDYSDLGIDKEQPFPGTNLVNEFRIWLTRDVLADLSMDAICAGPHHAVVNTKISRLGQVEREVVAGWGAARHGQLGKKIGEEKISRRSIPTRLNELIDGTVLTIAAGHHHTAFLHTSGRVSALGSNRKNQLNGLNDLHHVSQLGCTWHGTYAVVREEDRWSIVATGSNARGQLGRGRTAQDATQPPPPGPVQFPFSHQTHNLTKMACGSEHILCLFEVAADEGQPSRTEVWGWGWNEHGNLGIGNLEDQDLPVKVWPTAQDQINVSQPRVVDTWAGCGTSWIALSH